MKVSREKTQIQSLDTINKLIRVYLQRVGEFYQIKIVIIEDKVRHIDLDTNVRFTLSN